MQDHGHRLDHKLYEFSLRVSIRMDLGVSILIFFCFRVKIFYRPCGICRWMGCALDHSFNMGFIPILPIFNMESILGVVIYQGSSRMGAVIAVELNQAGTLTY